MAVVVKDGKRYCVAHGKTGAVLKRKGRKVCFISRSEAQAEARRTKCRVMGGSHCPR